MLNNTLEQNYWVYKLLNNLKPLNRLRSNISIIKSRKRTKLNEATSEKIMEKTFFFPKTSKGYLGDEFNIKFKL